MILTFKIETRLLTMNEIVSYAGSRQTRQYSKQKKISELLIREEVKRQIEIKNYFGHNATVCRYEWHTSTNFDLGNLAIGEKFLADSFTELGLWDDDRYIKEIHHKKIVDNTDYVAVSIRGAKNRSL